MAIPEKFRKLANAVRNEIYGRDVREAIAKSIEDSGASSETAIKITEQLIDGSFDEAELTTEIERRLNELEEEYAPELNSVKSQLAQRSKSRGADVVYDFDIDNTGEVDVSSLLANIIEQGKTYFFPEGEYLLEGRLDIPKDTTLIGDKAVIRNKGFILKGSNVVIEGFTFKGHTVEGQSASIGISIDGGKNIAINNNTFDHTRLYGNDFLDNIQGNLKITKNIFIGDYSIFTGTIRPITLHGYDGFIFTENFIDCKTPGSSFLKMQGRYETDADGNNYVGGNYTKNSVVSNNIFKGTGETALSLYDGSGEIVVSNNVFEMGTQSEPVARIIDGKNNGTHVLTNKIRNIIITGNVVEGYYDSNGFRIQGAYGMEEEGADQVGIITNNILTNYFTESINYYHIEISAFHKGIIEGNIIDHNSSDDSNSAIVGGGVKTLNVANNVIKEGSILVTNTTKTTAGDNMVGKIDRVNISNNIIERFLLGGVYLRAINNNEVDIIMCGNHFNSDKGSGTTAQAHPLLVKVTPNIRTLILTNNIGYNSASDPGSAPDLTETTVEKLIDNNNTWNS